MSLSCSLRTTLKKQKGKPENGRRLLQHIQLGAPNYKIYRTLIYQQDKDIQFNRKIRDLNGYTQMIVSNQGSINLKPQWNIPICPREYIKIKRLTMPNASKDLEQLKLSYSADSNVIHATVL